MVHEDCRGWRTSRTIRTSRGHPLAGAGCSRVVTCRPPVGPVAGPSLPRPAPQTYVGTTSRTAGRRAGTGGTRK